MSTVLDALRKAEEGRGDRGGGGFDDLPPEPPRRRGPRWLWLLLGLVAMIAAFTWGLELSGDDDPAEEIAVTETEVAPEPGPVAALEPEPPVEVASAPKPDLRTAPPPQTRPKPRTHGKPKRKAPSPAEADMRADVERQTRVPVQMHGENRLDPNDPNVAQMSDRRRKVLERVMERRAEREDRRAKRLAARQESQGLREAIRSAATPEERETLLEEFREIRRIARAERKAASAERRLEKLEEQEQLEADGGVAPAPQPVPPPRVAAVTRPAEPPPPPGAPPQGAPSGLSGKAPQPPVQVAKAPAEPVDEGLRRPPSSAPQVRINILQYSNDPGRRFAYMSIEGNPAMTQVREGESYQGLTVKRIFPEKVEFAHQGSTFLLRAN